MWAAEVGAEPSNASTVGRRSPETYKDFASGSLREVKPELVPEKLEVLSTLPAAAIAQLAKPLLKEDLPTESFHWEKPPMMPPSLMVTLFRVPVFVKATWLGVKLEDVKSITVASAEGDIYIVVAAAPHRGDYALGSRFSLLTLFIFISSECLCRPRRVHPQNRARYGCYRRR